MLLTGLDGVGKTTILFQMKSGDVVPTVPTLGINVETFQHQNIIFEMVDPGLDEEKRPVWVDNCQNIDAIIFVVDSTDGDRLDPAVESGTTVEQLRTALLELEEVLNNDELGNIPILILANKQDSSRSAYH